MPGENCAIPGCSISRKDKGISIFKVPLANNEFNKKWRQDLINIILKYRQRDKSLNERIESHKLFIFEKHFTSDQIYVYPSRKSLKEGALPTFESSSPKCQCNHVDIIRTGITCKKIPCYMRDSACRWFIVKKRKIF